MKYKIKAYNILEFGQRVDAEGNPHQEDSIFPALDETKDEDRMFILCDGMGGHSAGEVASATVCEAMSRSVFNACHDAEGDFSEDDLRRAIADAYDALDKKDDGAMKKMGTTMTFLKLCNDGCYIAHMGDSRVYHIRPGRTRETTEILFVTEDHSLVNQLVKIGELTPEEAKVSKRKNIITRAMQPNTEPRCKADIYHTTDIKPGDYFFMCSDGMLEQMEDHNLQFIFSEEGIVDDEEKVRKLIDLTQDNRDNHSAFIIHVLDVSDPTTAVPTKKSRQPSLEGTVIDDERTSAKKPCQYRVIAIVLLVLILAVAGIAMCKYLVKPNGEKEQTEKTMPTSTDDKKADVSFGTEAPHTPVVSLPSSADENTDKTAGTNKIAEHDLKQNIQDTP